MRDFEKKLQDQFQNDRIPTPDFNKMWDEIETGRKKMRRKFNINKIVVAAASIAVIMVCGTILRPQMVNAAQTIISQIFGVKEEIKKIDPYVNDKGIEEFEQFLQVGRQELSEQDFKKFSALMQEATQYIKKMTTVENGERKQDINLLSGEEKERFEQVQQGLKPYLKKIDSTFIYTLEGARQISDFPIRRPSYIPEGYTLTKEEARTEVTIGKKSPVLHLEYNKGEFGFRIMESGIQNGENDEFSMVKYDQVKTYTKDNYEFNMGIRNNSNVKYMKVVIPENNMHPAYQIFMVSDRLTNEEMEKVLLSIIEPVK